MCYKKEVQEKNEKKFARKMEEESVPNFIRRYLEDLNSALSRLSYWGDIRDMFNYMIINGIINANSISNITPEDIVQIDATDINRYLKDKELSGMSPTTLQTRKNRFQGFWKYLAESNKYPITTNIVKSSSYKGYSSKKVSKNKMPSNSKLLEMEERIKRKPDDFIRIRNLSILYLLEGSGLRESELAGLDMEDVYLTGDDQEHRPYITVLGKGKYRIEEKRKVLLTGKAVAALKEWMNIKLEMNNIQDHNAVFLNRNGRRFNEENIKSLFKNYGNGLTPHMLRHWYATVMDRKFGSAFVQQQLGHYDINTTVDIYTDGTYEVDLSQM